MCMNSNPFFSGKIKIKFYNLTLNFCQVYNYLMTKKQLIMAFVILGFSHLASSTETTDTEVYSRAADKGLPLCIDDNASLTKIKETIAANKKSKQKYKEYLKQLNVESEVNLTARLIYSETLAANCPEFNKTILTMISEVIGNRIRKRGGNVNAVVFERDQFASSLNIYGESRYRDFLCPKDLVLWQQSLNTAETALSKRREILVENSVNYFLYKHSTKWTKEPWHLPEAEASRNSKVRDCLRIFDNATWN